jgi:hypothetical protein
MVVVLQEEQVRGRNALEIETDVEELICRPFKECGGEGAGSIGAKS